jgi:hypothetical protein
MDTQGQETTGALYANLQYGIPLNQEGKGRWEVYPDGKTRRQVLIKDESGARWATEELTIPNNQQQPTTPPNGP